LLPRLAVLAVLFIILLNPRQRTQLSRIERSRAAMLIDTSLSMTYAAADSETNTPAEQKDSQTAAATPFQSRSDAVVDALIGSDLLQTLSKSHEVSVYTFDSVLRGPAAIVHNDTIRFLNQPNQDAEPENNAAVSGTSADSSGSSEPTDTFLPQKLSDADSKAKLRELLQPSGSETRLSECLHQLVGQLQGRTLSGLVVISAQHEFALSERELASSRQVPEIRNPSEISGSPGCSRLKMSTREIRLICPSWFREAQRQNRPQWPNFTNSQPEVMEMIAER
jgi:hypothetical protein